MPPRNPTPRDYQQESSATQELTFRVSPSEAFWDFGPEYYPKDFTQMKKRELSRYGGNCGGESVSIKSTKNREFHVSGLLLQGEISLFQSLLDLTEEVDLISTTIPNGGMECFIKQGELGNQAG